MRALTMEELEFVSGGWGLEGPSPDKPEAEVVIVRAKRNDFSHENFRFLQKMERDAKAFDSLCNAVSQRHTYLLAEANERGIASNVTGSEVGGVVADFTIEGAIFKYGGIIGKIIGGGLFINTVIGARYRDEANQLERYMRSNGCPPTGY